jgi:hypothetical protein
VNVRFLPVYEAQRGRNAPPPHARKDDPCVRACVRARVRARVRAHRRSSARTRSGVGRSSAGTARRPAPPAAAAPTISAAAVTWTAIQARPARCWAAGTGSAARAPCPAAPGGSAGAGRAGELAIWRHAGWGARRRVAVGRPARHHGPRGGGGAHPRVVPQLERGRGKHPLASHTALHTTVDIVREYKTLRQRRGGVLTCGRASACRVGETGRGYALEGAGREKVPVRGKAVGGGRARRDRRLDGKRACTCAAVCTRRAGPCAPDSRRAGADCGRCRRTSTPSPSPPGRLAIDAGTQA